MDKLHCNICHGDGPHACGGTPTACPPGGHANTGNIPQVDVHFLQTGPSIMFSNFCIRCKKVGTSTGACYIVNGNSMCEMHFLQEP